MPFAAIVGQDDAKLALLLNAVDPRIGGVLLRGQKGSAKSTLARGLADLLPGSAPFVELPVGATEDRLVGTIHLAAALTAGEKRFDAGLLAAADGGVLYVDEVNLLPDHLVDVLLDVAASGVNRVEREGISHTHASRFLLVGSMNPEEGDLRPQFLDRFGLAVDVRASDDPETRASAVGRRLEFDSDPEAFMVQHRDEQTFLSRRLQNASPAKLPDALVASVSAVCASVGAEGLRADLTICRAAAALAGWEGRDEATAEDVRRVAPMALAHRARRDPFEPARMDRERLDQVMEQHLGPDVGGSDAEQADGPDGENGKSDEDHRDPSGAAARPGLIPLPQRSERRGSPNVAGGGTKAKAARGRVIGDRIPPGPISSVAVGATVRAAASRRSLAPQHGGPLVAEGDVREAVREGNRAHLIVVAVDASGSMGAPERVDAARSAVLGLLLDAYHRRDLVSLVAFRGEGADVLLRPTSSVEVARARLNTLATGGRTPLHAGLTRALEVANTRASTHRSIVVVITDGRATSAPGDLDPLDAAGIAADALRQSGVHSVVVDVEGADGSLRLGLARRLADRMGAEHIPVETLTAEAIKIAAEQQTVLDE